MSRIANRVANEVSQRYTIDRERQAFVRTQKENPKDRIEVEIGDSKQPDFKPQAKIMRWNNEVNFSLRAEEHPEAEIRTEGRLIKYITPEYEVHQYDLDPGDVGEDGGLEFEWVLPEKPSSNVLKATIQTKELDFFYQPELTQEEINEGAERPDDVVGSYAVYHKTKGGMNRADGMEYKTGKAFHIYRPFAHDANGDGVWCDLHIDEEKEELTVAVPQEFLDDAAYPVVVDPTFGYTSAGASDFFIASWSSDTSRMYGAAYSLPEDGTLNKITSRLFTDAASNENVDIFVSIYRENSAGTGSHDLVVGIEELNKTIATTETWYDFSGSSESLVADDYILAALGNGEDVSEPFANIKIKYDAVGARNLYNENSTGAGGYNTRKSEDPWTETASSGANHISIYATYTASGSPETATVSPVVITFTVPSVTATFESEQTASVAPVGITYTVPSVTATHKIELEASVSPVGITYTVPSVTATYESVQEATVNPVVVNFTVPDVTATLRAVGLEETSLINDADLVGYWKLDEDSGTTLVDEKGNNDLTATNSSIVGEPGRFNRAVQCDGANYFQKVNTTVALKPSSSQAFSVSFWMKGNTSSGTDFHFFSNIHTNNTDAGWWIVLTKSTGGLTYFYGKNGTGQNHATSLNITGLLDGEWHHVAITLTGMNGGKTIKTYKDGELVDNKTISGSGDIAYHSTMAFRVGGTTNCLFDDIAIFTKTLNADEVVEIFNSEFTSMAEVTPASITFTIPPTTATYESVQEPTVASVAITYTVPNVTATHEEVRTASVAPVVTTFTVPSVTVTYEAVTEATVVPQSITFTAPSVTATYEAVVEASVAPVAITYILPGVTASYVQVETVTVAPVVITYTIPAVTATYLEAGQAGVTPVVITFTLPNVTATYEEVRTASVSPVTVTFTVPSVAPTHEAVFDAEVDPVSIIFTLPEVTAQGSNFTADLEPVLMRFTAVTTTAGYAIDAVVSPVMVIFTLPEVTPEFTKTWAFKTKIDDTDNWTSKTKTNNSSDWKFKTKIDN